MRPYGGGAGMVMQAEPICDAYEDLCAKTGKRPRVIYMTPQGRVFNQQIAGELAKEEDLVFLCGHYEGVDERGPGTDWSRLPIHRGLCADRGELPAMVMIDCHLPGWFRGC